MKTQQVFLLLHVAGHLHDSDGETVGRGCKHSRGQGHVVLVQELCREQIRKHGSNTIWLYLPLSARALLQLASIIPLENFEK